MKNGTLQLKTDAAKDCIKCKKCIDILSPKTRLPVVAYRELESPQTLRIETRGQWSSLQVVQMAIDNIRARLRLYRKLLRSTATA
jgi:hypothetical protein